jgi:hypothetical protein
VVAAKRRRRVSGYVVRVEAEALPLCPAARRSQARGQLEAAQRRLLQVQRDVMAGATLFEAVADATVEGWHARMALTAALGGVDVALPQWDAERGRNLRDRLWLVGKTLEMWGVAP